MPPWTWCLVLPGALSCGMDQSIAIRGPKLFKNGRCYTCNHESMRHEGRYNGPIFCPELNERETEDNITFSPMVNNEHYPSCWDKVQPTMTLHQTDSKTGRKYSNNELNLPWPRPIIINSSHILNPLIPEDLDPITKLVVLTHGFKSNQNAFEKMSNAILDHDQNVTTLVVDWRLGAQKDLLNCEGWPGYLCAASNVRYVGAAIERVVRKLVTEKSEDPESVYIHCMGHSLGSHVCGFFGKYVKVKIFIFKKIYVLSD